MSGNDTHVIHVELWTKTIGWSTRKVRSIDRIADRESNVRGLDGLAHGPQWNLNPTAPCKGWSYLPILVEIIFPRTSTLKSPISQLPTMIISKPLTKCKSISQYNLTTQFIRNINVITQVNFNVNQSMFKWWPCKMSKYNLSPKIEWKEKFLRILTHVFIASGSTK